MKSRILLAVLAAIALLVAIVVFKHKPETETAVVITGSSTPTPTSTAESSYKLVVLTPEVFLQKANSTNKTTVSGSVTVSQGDTVITSDNGRARVRWPNGTFTTVEPGTTLTLTELSPDGGKSTLTLVVGDIWSKISKALGVGEYYNVQTQDAVAAVRGTIFRVSYHQHLTQVQSVEHVVKVYARLQNGNKDEKSVQDVSETVQAYLDATTPGKHKLYTRGMSNTDKLEAIYRRILREKDLQDTDVLKLSPSPTPTPTASPSASPKVTKTPLPSISVLPTVSLTPTPVASTDATPTPTATALPPVTLDSVFPQSITAGSTFSLEGGNFTTGRNVPRVTAVMVGGQNAAQFSIIIGGTSIFVQPPSLQAGTYDVSVLTTDGNTVTLQNAITIQ